MKQILLNVLNSFGYPVFLQGSLGADTPFPPAFFTFATIASEDISFDDAAYAAVYEFQVIFYADDPHTVENIAAQCRQKLIQAGFIPQGRGIDIPSEEDTHTGWVCNYNYIKEE